jgi:hypothetical protein
MNRRKPTPLVAGTDLDAVVLGREGSGVEQYRMTRDAEGLAIDAGTLHDLSPGTILRVVPQPISTSEDTLAFVRVVRAELTRSVVEPLEHAGRPAVAAAQIPPVTFARPVERTLSLSLRVALPAPSTVRAEDEAAAAAIASMRAQPNQLVEWVPAGQPAELRLAVAANAVWLVPPWGTLCTPRDIGTSGHPQCTSAADITPSVPLAGPDTRAALADSLQRVARTTNLLRVAATAAAPAERLEISLWINGVQRDESEGSRLVLELDDELELRARNTSDTPLDITVLFIDSRWGISLVYPDGADELGRLGSRSNEIVLAEGKINTETVGIERMLLIAVPARPGSVPDPFRFLAQPSLAASNGGGTRGPGSPAGGIRDLLERAGFIGGRTRGPTSDSTDAMIWVQAWETR